MRLAYVGFPNWLSIDHLQVISKSHILLTLLLHCGMFSFTPVSGLPVQRTTLHDPTSSPNEETTCVLFNLRTGVSLDSPCYSAVLQVKYCRVEVTVAKMASLSDEMSDSLIKKYTVVQLKDILMKGGIPCNVNKDSLQKRLFYAVRLGLPLLPMEAEEDKKVNNTNSKTRY